MVWNYLFFTLIYINIVFVGYTQCYETEQYFLLLKNNEKPEIPSVVFQSKNEQRTQKTILKFCSDSSTVLRKNAFILLATSAIKSKNREIRMNAVSSLLTGCTDIDGGIRNICSGKLLLFNQNDFNQNALDTLLKIIENSPMPGKNMLLLTGMVDCKPALTLIKTDIQMIFFLLKKNGMVHWH